MKNPVPAAVVIAGLFFGSIASSSCSKITDSSSTPKEQLVIGKWNINRIQLKLYYGGVFAKDKIIPQTQHPENFVRFEAAGDFEYKFNTTGSDLGTYQFKGTDSVISVSGSKTYRWKWLTLTDVLFTVMNTSTDPAYPGATVETYQTFVK